MFDPAVLDEISRMKEKNIAVEILKKLMAEQSKEALHLAKKKDEITIRSSAAEYLTYVASVGDQQDSIEMRYEDENIWLTQKMMATLYDVGLPTINEHIKKIYADSELEENATIRNFRIVQTEGSCQTFIGRKGLISTCSRRLQQSRR